MSGYIFAVVMSVITLAFVVNLLRRRQLREKYAGIWLVVSVAIIVLAAFPSVALRLASLLGVRTPSNLLLAAASTVLLLVTIQLSTEISALEEETRTIAEETAMLGARVARLEDDAAGPLDGARVDEEPGESPDDDVR